MVSPAAAKIDGSDSVGVTFVTQGNAASTANVIIKLARAPDGTNYETTPSTFLTFTNVLNGTTAVINYFAIPQTNLVGAASLKLVSVQNADSTVSATNCSVIISTKNAKVGK